MHGGLSTGAKTAHGLKKISDANLKHGKYTKDKLEAQRYAAKVDCFGQPLKELLCVLAVSSF